jgi:hypothetical protein
MHGIAGTSLDRSFGCVKVAQVLALFLNSPKGSKIGKAGEIRGRRARPF